MGAHIEVAPNFRMGAVAYPPPSWLRPAFGGLEWASMPILMLACGLFT